jgi:hypothetical protein
MTRSESIKEITAALIAFQSKLANVNKDGKANYGKYATLAALQKAIDIPLQECGLAVVQMPSGANCLSTLILHTSGEWIEATYEMKPTNNTPQGIGSCITYQRRYAIAAALNIRIDDDINDDDGDGASKPQVRANDTLTTTPTAEEETILLAVKMCATTNDLNALYQRSVSSFKNQNTLIAACKERKKELSEK